MSGRDQQPEHAQGGEPGELRTRKELLLMNLRSQTEHLRSARASWERTIETLILEGEASEREIGEAAGISGPAVHQRKVALRARASSSEGGDAEREFGAAGSKRVPGTSKDLESGEAPTTGRER